MLRDFLTVSESLLPRRLILVLVTQEAVMTKKRAAKDRGSVRSKANLGQKEAKQEALSKEQFSHMRGGKVADSLERRKNKETAPGSPEASP